MKQVCGHDSSYVKASPDGGTYCSECLPDGTQETYVKANVAEYANVLGFWTVASVPGVLYGKIAVTPCANEDEARKLFATLSGKNPAWLFDDNGEIADRKGHTDGG